MTTTTMKHEETLKMIKRVWGDLPVVDAKQDLRIVVLPVDVANAKRRDGQCCVFAQACKRSFGASKVLFLRTTAYVDLPGDDGNRRVERFLLDRPMRTMIQEFDKGNVIPKQGGFLLKRPSIGHSLDRKARASRKQHLREKLGAVKHRKYKKRDADNYVVIDLVRKGTGNVHFSPGFVSATKNRKKI